MVILRSVSGGAGGAGCAARAAGCAGGCPGGRPGCPGRADSRRPQRSLRRDIPRKGDFHRIPQCPSESRVLSGEPCVVSAKRRGAMPSTLSPLRKCLRQPSLDLGMFSTVITQAQPVTVTDFVVTKGLVQTGHYCTVYGLRLPVCIPCGQMPCHYFFDVQCSYPLANKKMVFRLHSKTACA